MLDTGQMAAATRYSTEHLRRLVRSGKFPAPVIIGRRFLWPASVLVQIANGGLQEAGSDGQD